MQEYCKYQQRLFTLPAPTVQSEHPFAASLYECLSFLGLQQFWDSTFYGIKCQAEKLQRQGLHLEALKVLINGLTEQSFWVKDTYKWWKLMCMSIKLIQDRIQHSKEQVQQPKQSLLKLFANAPQPWQGRDVAYCFAQGSLWSFEKGDLQNAIEHAKSAIYAEPSWGYAEYLLGWYGLFIEGIDPAFHFSRAIEANASLLSQLMEDPVCQQHPEMLNQIKQHMPLFGDRSGHFIRGI